MTRTCLRRRSTTTRLSPHELVDHTGDVTARHRANSHFPGAVERLSEAAAYASVTEEAYNDRGAAVAGAARPADIDAEEVALYGPDRQAIGSRRSKLCAHSRELSARTQRG
jgi:hypothetical protein